MKKSISVILAIFTVLLTLSLAVFAEGELDRIDFTVHSDIAGYTYRDYQRIFTVDTKGFRYLYSPISGSAVTAYKDGQAYRDAFCAGETYLISAVAYYPGKLETADDFGIYANGQKLSWQKDEFEMVYNPGSNQTNIAVHVQITATEPQDGGKSGNFFDALLESIRAFFVRLLAFIGINIA